MGFIVTMKHEILKVMTGKLLVMKETRKNHLYYFQGSTIIGSTATTIKDDKELETTRLCHMCLGPIGKKALLNLVK